MSRTVSLVQRVEIASPCPVSWDSMTGNEQVRFCGQCQLNVFNLSEMTAEEGERLIIEKEGKLCARIYRRRDGTILTRDCPVGLAAVRRRIVGFGVAVVASVMFVAGAAMSCIFGQRSEDWFEVSTYYQSKSKLHQWLGTSPPQFFSGRVTGGSIMILPQSTPPVFQTPESTDQPAQGGAIIYSPAPSNVNEFGLPPVDSGSSSSP